MGIAHPRMIIAYGARWGVHIHQDARMLIVLALLGLTVPTRCLAANPDNIHNRLPTNSTANIKLTVSQNPQPLIHLETRHASLGEILKQIAIKTGVLIHYSVLPEAPVTATCVGATASQIMDCLVAKQVGLVAHKATKNKPAEFWLLGSSVGSCQAVTLVQPTTPTNNDNKVKITTEQQTAIDEGNQNQTDFLLEKFKTSKDKAERAEALNNLISVGKLDDPNVRSILESALSDKDDSIRAQAVETLGNLDKDNTTDFLNKAMQDKSPEVRIVALGKAIKQPELLERALTDTDQTIRDYAQSLLATLKNNAR